MVGFFVLCVKWLDKEQNEIETQLKDLEKESKRTTRKLNQLDSSIANILKNQRKDDDNTKFLSFIERHLKGIAIAIDLTLLLIDFCLLIMIIVIMINIQMSSIFCPAYIASISGVQLCVSLPRQLSEKQNPFESRRTLFFMQLIEMALAILDLLYDAQAADITGQIILYSISVLGVTINMIVTILVIKQELYPSKISQNGLNSESTLDNSSNDSLDSSNIVQVDGTSNFNENESNKKSNVSARRQAMYGDQLKPPKRSFKSDRSAGKGK